jgi:hypothetical protein
MSPRRHHQVGSTRPAACARPVRARWRGSPVWPGPRCTLLVKGEGSNDPGRLPSCRSTHGLASARRSTKRGDLWFRLEAPAHRFTYDPAGVRVRAGATVRRRLDRACERLALRRAVGARSRCVWPTSAIQLLRHEHLRIGCSWHTFRSFRFGARPARLGAERARGGELALTRRARRALAGTASRPGDLAFHDAWPASARLPAIARGRCLPSRTRRDEPLTPLSPPPRPCARSKSDAWSSRAAEIASAVGP